MNNQTNILSMHNTYLMEGMAAVGDDVGLLSREAEAEGERLKADGALLFILGVVARDYGHGACNHCCVRVDVRGRARDGRRL